MTKNEFLLKLIRQKEHWIYPMPKFDSIKQLIQLDSQGIYYGACSILVEEDQAFECYLTSLKGLVEPLESMISSNHPVIEYRIEAKGLKEGYIYDDLLFCYYPGGYHEIRVTFKVKKSNNVDDDMTISQEENQYPPSSEKKSHEDKKSKVVQNEGHLISFLHKPSYHLRDPIKIHFINGSKGPKRIMIKCHDPIISPMEAEIFMKDEWSQEWFIRKNSLTKLLGNFIARTPFREIDLEVYIDGESKSTYQIPITICELDPYETSQVIANDSEFSKVLLQVHKFYFNALIHSQSKKDTEYHLDLLRACLNYNQKNTNNRLLYIWLLLEFGYKREAKSQMEVINRYEEYFSEHDDYQLIDLMNTILESGEKNVDMDPRLPAKPNWLQILAIARYAKLPTSSYDYYEDLYKQGVRKSFLFAEVLSLVNKHPMPPRVNDPMYMPVLKWALRKNLVSSGWLGKCEQYYYQLEKNIGMTSYIGLLLYEAKGSKNFLRLLVSMLMKEEAKTREAYDYFELALAQNIYIKDLEKYYIEAGYAQDMALDFGLIRSLGSLEDMENSVKDYLYVQIIENRTRYPIYYRRIYGKMAEEYLERTTFTENACKVLASIFDDWIGKRIHFFDQIMERLELIVGVSGYEDFLDRVIAYALLKKDAYGEKWLKLIAKKIGFEGMTEFMTYERVLDLSLTYGDHQGHVFMKIEDFRARKPEQVDPLLMILIEKPIQEIIDAIGDLAGEKSPMHDLEFKKVWYYHLSKAIVMNGQDVSEDILRDMILYYGIDQHDWLYAGIYHMLGKSKQETIEFFHDVLDAHAIIEPSLILNHRKTGATYIEFYAHPKSLVTIHYRYDEDQTYRRAYMEHLAFGMFVYPLKLYMDDTFEYYIAVENKENQPYIPCSDKISYTDRMDSKDRSSVEERITAGLLAYQMNDEDSAVSIIEEQIEYERLCHELIRF